MVLLAAAIFSKDGKALLSRQFVEMTRIRIEGLLTAFPKLIGTDEKISDKTKSIQNWKQHTFVETESVRYVYQPLEKLYVLLLTTKASNILEDLETLRLFAKVIPEYSRSLDEYDIKENIFDIIFAFDEIVALGYRENVNLAQIRTFTDMDSHEEKVFLAVRENQEKEAKEKMKLKAKELQAKRENKGNNYRPGYSNTGFGSSTATTNSYLVPVASTEIDSSVKVSMTNKSIKSKPGSGNAMRLGGKTHVVENFVDQLKAEGVVVEQKDEKRTRGISGSSGHQIKVNQANDSVYVRIEEKLKIESSHDSGLSNMELMGILMLRVTNKENSMLSLKIDLGDSTQLQTHPNIDKKVFQATNVLQPKSNDKAFPVGQDIGLLKWRFQTQEEDQMPLIINCWPNKTSNGCSVNIEYELQKKTLDLHEVVISIPLPPNSGAPSLKDYDGEYSLDARKTHIQWVLQLIDAENSTGSMEFETKTGQVEDFFPIIVSFHSEQTYTGLKITEVLDSSRNPVTFGSDTSFISDKFEIA